MDSQMDEAEMGQEMQAAVGMLSSVQSTLDLVCLYL